MKSRVPAFLLALAVGLSFFQISNAAVIFKPGKKVKYVAPGEEEMSGNAEELFHRAQTAENQGNLKKAIKLYTALVRKHPRDALAAGSIFRTGELQEKIHNSMGAVQSFRLLMERYPSSPHFDEAVEGLFRIGEAYLQGKKVKLLGIPVGVSLDRAVEIFAAVIRSAPYGKYTARAQFDIGLARERQHMNDSALEAYQAVVDKFPNQPVAADAQYQIGYIWMMTARAGTRDLAATKNARTAFSDFLFRYPNSEKAAQAQLNLKMLENRQTASAFDVARFYDKQKRYRAAVIYYNEVIREEPNSPESDKAKKRIDQLRAKVGDAALKPLDEDKEAKGKGKAANQGKAKTGIPGQQGPGRGPGPGSSGDENGTGPLPPPDTDLSLPPPPSSSPPASGTSSDSINGSSGSSSSPDTSATPEETPPPIP
jgi:outer membrane protein assembly factor BamD